MSNPDSTGANIGGISILGSFVGFLVVILFNYQHVSAFPILLYVCLPIVIYVLMFVVIYISKKNVDVKNAFLSAVPSIGTTYLALFISYISYFRIPIASVFAPLFLDTAANIIPHPISEKAPNAPNVPNVPNAPMLYAPTARVMNDIIPNEPVMRTLNSINRNSRISRISRRGGSHKKQSGGACCNPTYSLEGVESQYPIVKGLSYAFYLFFAICFGGIFGSSIPNV